MVDQFCLALLHLRCEPVIWGGSVTCRGMRTPACNAVLCCVVANVHLEDSCITLKVQMMTSRIMSSFSGQACSCNQRCTEVWLLLQAFEVLTDWDKRESYNQELQHALISGDDDYTGKTPQTCPVVYGVPPPRGCTAACSCACAGAT